MKIADKRKFRERNAATPETIPGRMGDGFGHVKHETLANYVYVRIAGVVQVIYNDRVPVRNNLDVECGYDILGSSEKPGRFMVLSTRTAAPGGAGVTVNTVGKHGKSHQLFRADGGDDPVWIDGRQILDLQTWPYSGMQVHVYQGIVDIGGGIYKLVPSQLLDLTAHIPTTPGNAALVLITVNTAGALVATKGTEFVLADMTTPALMLANIPYEPADTAESSAAVRVYYGQTEVKMSGANLDIIDLRRARRNTMRDFGTEVARGKIPGFSSLNKYGHAPSGIQTTDTDIWSRADATPTQQIWLAPTAARIHALVSDSANDTAAGTGLRTVRVYGLKTWATSETSEVVTMNGTTPVNMADSYVIIYRMVALTWGTTGPNVGTITATAATDNTVTAVIMPGDGQTEMAIFGVPSTQTFFLKRWGVEIDKTSAAAVTVDFQFVVNPSPATLTTAFIRKLDFSLQSNGTSSSSRYYDIPPAYPGPCIIKIQASASAADTDAKSGFDGYLVNN